MSLRTNWRRSRVGLGLCVKERHTPAPLRFQALMQTHGFLVPTSQAGDALMSPKGWEVALALQSCSLD